MTIGNRIKQIRQYLGINQKDFGKKIAVAQTYQSQLEKGDRDVTEKILKLICLEFKVNEQWLRTGEGEMFIKTDDSLISELAKEYKLDSIDQFIVEFFVKCSPSERQKLKDFACALAAKVNEVHTKELSAMNEDDIEKEVEEYRKELLAKKITKTSSASGTTKEKNA